MCHGKCVLQSPVLLSCFSPLTQPNSKPAWFGGSGHCTAIVPELGWAGEEILPLLNLSRKYHWSLSKRQTISILIQMAYIVTAENWLTNIAWARSSVHSCDPSTFGRPKQVDDLRSGVWDQPGQHGETCHLYYKIPKKISWAWWCAPVIPATQEAETEESLEPRRWRLQWAEIAQLHSSLGDKARLSKKKGNM